MSYTVFTDGEMGLLIDGIESINVLSPDSKIGIYEKDASYTGTNKSYKAKRVWN